MRQLQLFMLSVLLLTSIQVSPAGSMTFRLAEPDTADGATPGWIVADGEITADSAKSFRDFLMSHAQMNSRSVVLINSRGGSLLGGLALGEVIREFGLGTRVGRSIPDPPRGGGYISESEAPGECFSACAFAFLGGKWRVAQGQSIGVHQHYNNEALKDPRAKAFTALDLSAQQVIAGIMADYIVRMGVDARFLTRASMTGPSELYRFSSEDMEKFAITWNDLAYSDWVLDAYESGLIAVSKTKNAENTATLFCRSDHALRLMLAIPKPCKTCSDVETIESITTHPAVALFGKQIPEENISARIEKNIIKIEFKLPASIAPDSASSKGMGAFGSNRFWFYHELRDRNFKEFAYLIMRNCIGP